MMIEGGFVKKVWVVVFFVIIWFIWKERNVRIFDKVLRILEEIKEMILLRLGRWIKAWEEEFFYLSEELVRVF